MSDYFFHSNKITEKQVKEIIKTAEYSPSDYTYRPLIDNDGYQASGAVAMAITRLENAAKHLGITVTISAGPELSVSLSSSGHAGNLPEMAAAASTTYSLDFINDTPNTWVFSVYQTLPNSPALKSLSWKQTTVPRSGESGVKWGISYQAAVLNYKQDGGKGVYKASQRLDTSLGDAWNVVFQGGTQELIKAGSAPGKGQVIINNKTTRLADLGIGMDNDIALVQPQVYGGASANFEVEPTYWVAMYKDVVKGEVISGAQVAGPIEVKFLNGATNLTFRAWLENAVLNFAPTDDSTSGFRAPLDQAIMRAEVMQRRGALALTP